MKKHLCKLIGHTADAFDEFYPVCGRCGSHCYYNVEEWELGWYYWPMRFYDWMQRGYKFLKMFCASIKSGASGDDIPF